MTMNRVILNWVFGSPDVDNVDKIRLTLILDQSVFWGSNSFPLDLNFLTLVFASEMI